jgi:hypothetical protein
VSKTKVVLAIFFIQLVQVETKCWIEDGARNEEFSFKKQNFNSICNPKYLTISIDAFLEAVILKMIAALTMR